MTIVLTHQRDEGKGLFTAELCGRFTQLGQVLRQCETAFWSRQQRGYGSVPVSAKRFALRSIAPCCPRTWRQVLEVSFGVDGIRLHQHALKARNI